MAENYVIIAVPLFFVLMGLEVAVVRWQGKDYYRLGDAVNSISCGIIAQLLEAVVGVGPGMALYAFAGRLAPGHLNPSSPWTWILSFACVDFLYYWWHRFNHEVNFLWAGHIVHHQSEEYNLSTALRQSWPTNVTAAFFFLPMAVLGIPFQVYFGGVGLMLLYQFWIHTRVIGRLGPLEWVLNTPSHHRVHHGVNPEYIDKNYAGILIVWDRLFGTFEEERAPVIYGTVKPIATWDPIRNNLDYWRELTRRSLRASGLKARVLNWWVGPAWTAEIPHPSLKLSEYRPASYRKFEGAALGPRALVAFAVILVLSGVLLNIQGSVPAWARLAFAALMAWGLSWIARTPRSGPTANRSYGAKWPKMGRSAST